MKPSEIQQPAPRPEEVNVNEAIRESQQVDMPRRDWYNRLYQAGELNQNKDRKNQ